MVTLEAATVAAIVAFGAGLVLALYACQERRP
jgi:hypothetical protein